MRYLLASVVVVAATSSTAVGPGVQAVVVTCQGQAATVVGPTEGQDTTGTEGDDVIVAPLSSNSRVNGLGGNDTICLVDGPSVPGHDAFTIVLAGAGDDRVYNETTSSRLGRTELGAGSDHFVGNDSAEVVFGATSWEGNGPDTEVDVIRTGGGNDTIHSGRSAPGHPNHDVVATGAGEDSITYWNADGEAIDNGDGADRLFLTFRRPGDATIDNVSKRATLNGVPVLTWTSVSGFGTFVGMGTSVSFVGADDDESLQVSGSVDDLTANATITTGGGDDDVRLDDYLPTRVDTGEGYDSLTYLACHRAYVALSVSAECLTSDAREVSTKLAGIEYFFGETTNGLTVEGSARAERVTAFARYVLVRSGPGADRVHAAGRTAQVVGGRGDDKLKAVARVGGLVFGGRGSDVVRGSVGPDRLLGGLGEDTAYGRKGRDLCVAEVRHSCEVR